MLFCHNPAPESKNLSSEKTQCQTVPACCDWQPPSNCDSRVQLRLVGTLDLVEISTWASTARQRKRQGGYMVAPLKHMYTFVALRHWETVLVVLRRSVQWLVDVSREMEHETQEARFVDFLDLPVADCGVAFRERPRNVGHVAHSWGGIKQKRLDVGLRTT